LKEEDGRSIPKINVDSRQEEGNFDFVIIAQDQFSKQDSEASLPWKGIDKFKEHGGKVFTRQSLDDFCSILKKQVAIVGFGKIDVDFCQTAVEFCICSTVHHASRTPRWLVAQSVFGLRGTYLRFLSVATV
jgi:hypothetical protein